jgi:tight adherence protein C
MTASLFALKLLAVGTAFFAALLGVHTIASAPAHEASYLGIRGLKRARSLQNNPMWANVEPMVRWLAARVRPLLRQSTYTKLDRQITLAGDFWGLVPEEFVALSILACGGGGMFGAIYALLLKKGLLYPLLGAGIGAMLPFLQLSGIEQERHKHVQNGLPFVIDLLSLGLSAGLDFVGALRQVVDKSSNPNDPLIEELNFILQELSVGKTRKQALTQFAERVPGESVREFVGAVVQAEERGNPLGRVLQIQAEVSRQRRSVRAEEAASKASVKMLGPMVLVFAAILLLIVTPMALGLKDHFSRD